MFDTNNERGRAYALIIGIYFILKTILNIILGDNSGNIIYATLETVVLFAGIQYANYVIAGITAFVFCGIMHTADIIYYLKGNLSAPLNNILYIIEGVIDIYCAYILIFNGNVKEHFTNKLTIKK